MNPNNPRFDPRTGQPIAQAPPPEHSLLDAIRGPIMLVVLGILMAADQMDRYGIDRTWPALLILFGLLKVASYMGGGTRE